MNNNFNSNPTAVCRWHQNPYIVGSCPRCGAYICPQCALPLFENSYSICPNCFKEEYNKLIVNSKHRKHSAILLTILGILFTIASTVFMFYSLSKKYGDFSENFTLDNITYALNALTGGYPAFLLVYVLGFIFTIFCGLGFFFGLRNVCRWFRKLPIVIIIFSVIFFVIIIGFALQIAWLIGGFVMIKEFIDIRKINKQIDFMTNTLTAYRL